MGTTDVVGFVGLGQMGSPMASHLVSWPGGLVVCDARAEARDILADRGAQVARTPADVAGLADVVSVMVLDDEQVKEVVLGPDGILAARREGLVIGLHSTIHPTTAERLAELCEPRGVAVVDAPVSGGSVGAREGRLAVMVGGDDDAVERCRGPFGMWAELFVHTGPVGSGTRAKLAGDLVRHVSRAAVVEAQRLAAAAGISLDDLVRVVRHSDAITSWHDTTAHGRDVGPQDLLLALQVGHELGVDLPLARLALDGLAADPPRS